MYKSIVQFIENETPKIEKFIKKFIKGEKDIDEISYFLSEKTNGMIKNIITEVWEQIKWIRKREERMGLLNVCLNIGRNCICNNEEILYAEIGKNNLQLWGKSTCKKHVWEQYEKDNDNG